MAYRSLAILAALASVSMASTPPGFEPATENSLVVVFGDTPAMDGVTIEKAVAQSAPKLGTLSKLEGTSFAVMMIDLDVPTPDESDTTTLLHWFQTGLTQSSSATDLGGTTAFEFTPSTGVNPLVDYFGPNPPAKMPLSHRYTQILIDTSGVTDADLTKLEQAVSDGVGFDGPTALVQAGLSDNVVAGNWFVVTNNGPGAWGNGTQARQSGSASGTIGLPGATGSPIVITPGAAVRDRVSYSLLGLAVIAALCSCL